MIDKTMFREVQAFKRQGYFKGAIVRALELDPKTVAKYFAMEEEDFRAYRQEHLFRDKAFDRFRREILEVYESNDFRGLQVSSVYDYLEERHGALNEVFEFFASQWFAANVGGYENTGWDLVFNTIGCTVAAFWIARRNRTTPSPSGLKGNDASLLGNHRG